MLLLKNGVLLDPYTETEQRQDILIDDQGVIAAIAPNITEPAEIIDLTGKTVSPVWWMCMFTFAIPA